MAYKYATQDLSEKHAKAVLLSQQISIKACLEISKQIKKKTIPTALRILDDAINFRRAIPYTQYNWKVGHKKTMAAGRFPVTACQAMVRLIKSAQANAADKQIGDNLIIHSIVPQKGTRSYHHGRVRGIKFKNTHVELVLVPAPTITAGAGKQKAQSSKAAKSAKVEQIEKRTEEKTEKAHVAKAETTSAKQTNKKTEKSE